jgi:hypothetical protein
MFMSTAPLDALEPTDRSLLEIIAKHVDDAMLLQIAHADYSDDVEIHLAELQQIKAGQMPKPIRWHPGEVLSLTRYTELDYLKTKDDQTYQRVHWMRLFACTALIWASLVAQNHENEDEYDYELWNHLEGEESTIIQFLESALYLGHDISIAALQFLGWRMQKQIQIALIDEDFRDCPVYAIAMLLLCVSLDRYHPEIVSFLISMAYCNGEHVLIAREIDGQHSQKWRDTIYRILLDPTTPHYTQLSAVHPELQNLARELMVPIAEK